MTASIRVVLQTFPALAASQGLRRFDGEPLWIGSLGNDVRPCGPTVNRRVFSLRADMYQAIGPGEARPMSLSGAG